MRGVVGEEGKRCAARCPVLSWLADRRVLAPRAHACACAGTLPCMSCPASCCQAGRCVFRVRSPVLDLGCRPCALPPRVWLPRGSTGGHAGGRHLRRARLQRDRPVGRHHCVLLRQGRVTGGSGAPACLPAAACLPEGLHALASPLHRPRTRPPAPPAHLPAHLPTCPPTVRSTRRLPSTSPRTCAWPCAAWWPTTSASW